jgi:hypothetical protein
MLLTRERYLCKRGPFVFCLGNAFLSNIRRTLSSGARNRKEQRLLVNPEPLTELLRTRTLRYVAFDAFISPLHSAMQRLMD